MKYATLALTVCSALAFTACGEKKTTTDASAPTGGGALESVIVKTEPAGAQSITEVRKAVEIGKEITLSGKVMGSRDPFVAGRALLVLGDPAIITSCDLRSGDSCVTPWDVCCDEPEDIKAATATIQVVDSSGKPIKQGLKGVNGIKELSSLIVKGVIAEGSNADNLLINATAIYVSPSS